MSKSRSNTKENKKNKEKRTKITKKSKMIIPVCAAVIVILSLVINLAVINTAKPLIVTAEQAAAIFGEGEKADCILVLGASVTRYGPSPMLADRLDKGMELFGLGVSDIMLFSGDNGTVEYNEVQVMKEYALRNGEATGLAAANIYLDYAGFSTYSSAKRCKDVFQAERIVIVTQRYHLYRAVYDAKLAGLDVVGVAACDTKSGQWLRDLREIPARVKDFFLANTGYVPKIMGDPVPLDYPSTSP